VPVTSSYIGIKQDFCLNALRRIIAPETVSADAVRNGGGKIRAKAVCKQEIIRLFGADLSMAKRGIFKLLFSAESCKRQAAIRIS
jgi:hypothetical protein